MTITLDLPPATLDRLRRHSASTGKDVNDCIETAVESYLNLTTKSFDELFAPLRKQVAESGLSDDQVDDLLQEAIDESRAERKLRRQGR